MIHEAIVELADRSGSSVPAIEKFIKSRHEEMEKVNPKVFHTSILAAIKSGIKDGKLIKVKCSYKMNSEWIKSEKKKHQAKEAKKKAAEKKRKKEAEEEKKKKELLAKREKMLKEEAIKAEKERIRLEEERKIMEAQRAISQEEQRRIQEQVCMMHVCSGCIWCRMGYFGAPRPYLTVDNVLSQQQEELNRKKEAEAKEAKERDDRLKRRRFPMDDLELIAEDKELGVKKPADVTKSPFLPFVLQSLEPHDTRSTTKKSTPGGIISSCSTTVSSGSRGLISDVLQVYHFFVGDIGYARMVEGLIPKFSLRQLLYAVNEIVCGNAKKSKAIPPLICRLFVAVLTVLTSPKAEDWVSDDEACRSKFESLKTDLRKLKQSLSASSWSETLVSYMDVMERFYTSDASKGSNTWAGYSVVMEFSEEDDNADQVSQEDIESDLPSGYGGYVGPSGSALNRAFMRLKRHDPWHLQADELIATLRSLTDDILAMKPDMAKQMDDRDQKLYELLKLKKSTESHFRKIRLAYEGPKFPKASKVKKEGGTNEGNEVEKVPFKPTATKAEFEAATKAKDKAAEQYEKGLKTLVHRTQPIGFDRNHNAIYFFHFDPECLYVEVNRSPIDPFNEVKSWHCIDSKTLFDSYVSSLDIRGVRENNLYEQLMGESGASSLKRYLYDSNKKESLTSSYERQKAELERRLDNALIANMESTRRSGRLANTAKDEVSRIQEEIAKAKVDFEKQLAALDAEDDYSILTGSQLVSEFEIYNSIIDSCSLLWHDSEEKPGIIGIIARDLLQLEDICETLSPWDNPKISRQDWRKVIMDISESWRNGCTLHLGSKGKEEDESESSSTKRQRLSLENETLQKSPGPSISFEHALSTFKGPLLDLEQRIYSISGLERATKDVDEANDNVTVVSNDSDTGKVEAERLERANYAWKRKIYSLHSISHKRAAHIRDVLVSAIAVARKANLTDVLEDLRECLKLHRPGAGGRARTMALTLIQKYGFELREGDEEEADDDDSLSEVGSVQDAPNDSDEQGTTLLPTDAMVLSGCLEGDEQADRVDWKDAVSRSKTVSRFAALVTVLKSRALPVLEKLSKDKKTLLKAIPHWETSGKLKKKTKKGTKPVGKKYDHVNEVWADASVTDQFVLCKVEGFPWWPARVCVAKDIEIAQSLKSLSRELVSFIGEQHLYVVHEDDIKPFHDKLSDEEVAGFSPEVVKNVKEGLIMAKRIIRGKGINTGDLTGMSIVSHAEEKKTSS